MSYFIGEMLVLQTISTVSRHTDQSVWRVIECIKFNSSNDANMNQLTKYTDCYTHYALVPVCNVAGYTPVTKNISRQFDPKTSTALWQAQH